MLSVKRLPQIVQDMLTYIAANQSKVTDFNEGSVIRSFCESVGIEIEDLFIKVRVGFERELKGVPFYAFDFEKKVATKAAGTVIFSRTGTTGDAPILTGTLLSTADGIRFVTTADGVISDGNTDSAAVPIEASDAGSDGNVPASTITTIVTPVTGVDSVNNTTSTTGGADEESDAEFLDRFQIYIEGLSKSNNAGLVEGATSVTDVRSASVIEHFPPVSGYNVTVYIDDGAGNASQQMIDDVTSVLIGDGTATNPGYKASGCNLRVLPPTKVTVDVTVEITSDGTFTDSTLQYNAEVAISNYINNLLIGEDVILNTLRREIMKVAGIYDISVTDPSSNTSIGSAQIARVGTITITFA